MNQLFHMINLDFIFFKFVNTKILFSFYLIRTFIFSLPLPTNKIVLWQLLKFLSKIENNPASQGLIWTAAIFTDTGNFTDENFKRLTGFSGSLFNKKNLMTNKPFRKSSVFCKAFTFFLFSIFYPMGFL